MRAEGRRLLGASPGPPRQVGLVLDPAGDARPALAQVARWARRSGVRAVVAARAVRGPLPTGIDPVAGSALACPGGVLLALGALPHAVALGAASGTPVLAAGGGELEAALDALSAGRFAVEERTLLAIRRAGCTELAVNDVVLRRTAAGTVADVAVRVGGEELARRHGDGVIVATASGSAGYSHAAGGPIVSPRLPVTLVTALAPRAAAPPLVLAASEPVELHVCGDRAALAVELDGTARPPAAPGTRLRVSQAPARARLIRPAGTASPLGAWAAAG